MEKIEGQPELVPGYDSWEAPAIVLSVQDHMKANTAQNTTPRALPGNYGLEGQVAIRALVAANQSHRVDDAIDSADDYFVRRLHLTDLSPTNPLGR